MSRHERAHAARREELASQAHTTLLVARVMHAARQLEHEEFSARDVAWFRRPLGR